MFDFIYNKSANPQAPANSCCANCANAEIESQATLIVSGEPMCDGCIDAITCMCEQCDAIVESDDCEHGERGEYVCYDCGNS